MVTSRRVKKLLRRPDGNISAIRPAVPDGEAGLRSDVSVQSNFLATSLRCHPRIVSGLTIWATSSSAFLPSCFPMSANDLRSPSVRRKRPFHRDSFPGLEHVSDWNARINRSVDERQKRRTYWAAVASSILTRRAVRIQSRRSLPGYENASSVSLTRSRRPENSHSLLPRVRAVGGDSAMARFLLD